MKVYLRDRRGILHLYYRLNGRRHEESLQIRLSDEPIARKEQMKLAEAIRAKMELRFASSEHGLLDPTAGRRSLIGFAEELAKDMAPKNPLPKALPYLRDYAGEVHLGAITERWIEGFQSFLAACRSETQLFSVVGYLPARSQPNEG